MAMIKKCAGFDMNMLCYDPAYENHDYIKAIQETMDLRQARGISKEKNWIKYVTFEEALRHADLSASTCPCCVREKAPRQPIICSTSRL